MPLRTAAGDDGRVGVGVLGAGNFARTVLLPAIVARRQLRPVVLCSASGLTAAHGAQRMGFEAATADEDEVFADPAAGHMKARKSARVDERRIIVLPSRQGLRGDSIGQYTIRRAHRPPRFLAAARKPNAPR